jgi:DNA-binding transcriptional MerR regulator
VFRIGDFSRIARVSCRQLRFYDELGLLEPALVDQATGYRFYTAAQLAQLNRILVLKELGLNLDQIGRIVKEKVSVAELRAMLLLRRNDVEQVIAAESDRLRRIESRILQIEEEGHLSIDDVVIRSEPARRILSVRAAVPSFVAAREIIRSIVSSVPRRLPKDSLGALIAIAQDSEFEPEKLDVEFGYVLNADVEAPVLLENGTALQMRELPPVEKVAACVRIGLPEDAHRVTAKIGRFAETNGYMLAGASREVFLRPPQLDRMQDSMVEMQFPLATAHA